MLCPGYESCRRRVLQPRQSPRSERKIRRRCADLQRLQESLEIHPVKGSTIKIPYDQIDKFAYEYTKKHRVTEGTIATAAIGIGAVAMLTKSKSHWLEIAYHEEDLPKTYALRMDKRNYIRILEAVKNHTGKDAEVLGNADKRRR